MEEQVTQIADKVTQHNIVSFGLEGWNKIVISFNWLAVILIIVAIVGIIHLIKFILRYSSKKSITIEEVSLGIGNSSVTLKYNPKDREIAYKLWVELSTRKIGIPFDENNDVIEEVYNSWYAFFGMARDLLKELPAIQINASSELIELTEKVLNNGLRPHLTIWQAKFRCWYENNKGNPDKTPQQLQKEYPLYEELIKDLLETNSRMIKYKELMKQIAFGK